MNPLLAALAGVALVLAAAAVWLLLRRSSAPVVAPARARRRTNVVPAVAPAVVSSPAAAAVPLAQAVLPAELAAFARIAAQDLAPERQAAFVKVFHDVPRPPKLLQHLMSSEFLNAASSVQLVELISAEPLIAAKVLGAVNSPLYALKAPVRSAGQAVTYLGLNSVRSLCLQYILISAFKADTPVRKQALDAIWQATALASELAHQLSYRLNLPEPGTTVSAVVLSFLGRLATAATMPPGVLAQVPARDFLQRSRAEQELLGLCAGEIGRLLMRDWGLPEHIVADTADIDTLLVAPAGHHDRGARLALGYLCARLGEQLASGQRSELLSFSLSEVQDTELHHLKSALGDTRLARLAEFVREPSLSGEVQRMLAAFRR